MPAALAEWYLLVGKRLRAVQDRPQLLSDVSIRDGWLETWIENQDVWSILTAIEDGDDPICIIEERGFTSPDAPLSRTLFAMLASDTLMGACSGLGAGTLGVLAVSVRGGHRDIDVAKVLRFGTCVRGTRRSFASTTQGSNG